MLVRRSKIIYRCHCLSWSPFTLVPLGPHNQRVRLSFWLYPQNRLESLLLITASYSLTCHPSLSDFIFCHFPRCSLFHSAQNGLLAAPWIYLAGFHLRLWYRFFTSSWRTLPPDTFVTCSPISLRSPKYYLLRETSHDTPYLLLPVFFRIIHIYDIVTLSPVFFTLVSSRRGDFCFPTVRTQPGTFFFHLSLNIVQYQMIFISWNAVIFYIKMRA